MPLLNYSTSIPATRSRMEIIGLLAARGARRISQDLEQGRTTGISFTLDTAAGQREFALPARVAQVQKVLHAQWQHSEGPTRSQSSMEHAERVAWRIVLEWLKVQIALIDSAQAVLPEVMLPYMLMEQDADGRRRSLYDHFVDDTRALPAPTEAVA